MASSLFGSSHSIGSPVQQSLSNDIGQVKELLRNSANPMSTMQTLASRGNPNAQAALSYLQNGSTPKQAVLNILQERGIPVQLFMQNPLFK